ncbi:MAG: DEAD/DEAH box helicase, partial [Elusimicrobia bacterium]|nr:DEAD/DEAH box helicase [Elusimicrobiota bacterium]
MTEKHTENIAKNVRYLKGVGPARAKQLSKMGIITVEDLLTYFPKRYEDRSRLRELAVINDEDAAFVKVKVINSKAVYLRNRRKLVKISVKDNTGTAEILAFNQGYLKDIFKEGSYFYLYGKFERKLRNLTIANFVYEKCGPDKECSSAIHLGRITPVYSLTGGVSQKWLRKLIYENLNKYSTEFKEFLPGNDPDRLGRDINETHFPKDFKLLKHARKDLICREFLLFQIALGYRKEGIKKLKKERPYKVKRNLLTPFKESLGFKFTASQKKVINEIFKDMKSPYPMRRLLQGDVGSGKTVVALSAILLAVENSYSAAVIAPTEILAEQHYLTFKNYLDGLGVGVGLIRGGLTKKEKEKVTEKLR